MTFLRACAAVLVAVCLLPAAGRAQGPQPWPTQAVRIVVAVSAGSQSDIIARAMAEELGKAWGREVIVENRPGLAGTASIAKATPDGHTLFLTSNGHAIIQSLNRNLSFDPIKDFSFISRIAILPGILVGPPEGAKTLQELVAIAKASPGKLNYASAGLGTASYMAGELLKRVAAIDIVHVPHKGIPDAHTSIMRADAALFMTFYSAAGDLIASGKLRALAIAANRRTPVLPDIPTVGEVINGYTYDAWFGYFGPAGIPAPLIDRLNKDIAAVAALPSIAGRFAKLGVDISTSSPQAFEALVKSDTERFVKIFGRAEDQPPARQ